MKELMLGESQRDQEAKCEANIKLWRRRHIYRIDKAVGSEKAELSLIERWKENKETHQLMSQI